MAHNYNPARRLFELLTSAVAMNSNQTTQVWDATLAAEGSPTVLLQRFVALDRLYRETVAALEKVEGLDRDLYVGQIGGVENILQISTLLRSWEDVKKGLSPTTMLALRFCASYLDEKVGEAELERAQLDDLRRELEELVTSLLESGIDARLKELLVTLASEMRTAILEYRISGAAALEKALEIGVGAFVLNRNLIQEHTDLPEVNRFGMILERMKGLLDVAQTARQLAEPIIKMLMGG